MVKLSDLSAEDLAAVEKRVAEHLYAKVAIAAREEMLTLSGECFKRAVVKCGFDAILAAPLARAYGGYLLEGNPFFRVENFVAFCLDLPPQKDDNDVLDSESS